MECIRSAACCLEHDFFGPEPAFVAAGLFVSVMSPSEVGTRLVQGLCLNLCVRQDSWRTMFASCVSEVREVRVGEVGS